MYGRNYIGKNFRIFSRDKSESVDQSLKNKLNLCVNKVYESSEENVQNEDLQKSQKD